MPERRVHFAGSPIALGGYPFAPCGASLIRCEADTEETTVTCHWCRQWINRYMARAVVDEIGTPDG